MGIGSTGRAIGRADKVLGTNLQMWFYAAIGFVVIAAVAFAGQKLGLLDDPTATSTETIQTYDQAAAAASAKAAARDAQAKAARDAR
jgi:hypothetical protein